ncbi:MAG: hypothetical protein HYY21_09125 [Candidatus Tectomicrobia bacterium]|nr:hypothetical protein [Candidatus Tectomicrobia bacterium]
MGNLKEQLFLEFASEALSSLTEEFREKYVSKKGDRFNVQGLTYEIGSPVIKDGEIEFEISSKIPQDELGQDMTQTKYFNAVKAIIRKGGKKPKSIDMENIIRETREDARKERDYVKVTYGYRESELYSQEEIAKQIEECSKNPGKKIPEVAGIATLGGRVVLMTLRDTLRQKARENLQLLIDANNEVRKELKARK